ncbi:AbrB/MazE/SpoVT family DNA-binding domain-containing protein [Candidatus Tisiphia endosymbiont of Micropterix aruncella]
MYRKSLRLKEGDEIVFNLNNNELTLIPIKTSVNNILKCPGFVTR